MARGKNKKSAPTAPSGNATASGSAPPAGTMDVYCATENDGKTYLGWVTDSKKLAFFSRAAARIIHRRPTPTELVLMVPNVDKKAAEILIRWINENNTTQPLNFILDVALFGPEPPSFEIVINVHYAGHALDLVAGPRGQVVRNAIFHYLEKPDPLIPTADEFKLCWEKGSFDGGIIGKVMNQVMFKSIVNRIDPDELEKIKQYCRETGKYEDMVAMGEAVIKRMKKPKNNRKGKGKVKERVLEHGW